MACQVCPDMNAVFSDCAPTPGATDHPVSGEKGTPCPTFPAVRRSDIRPVAR